MISNDFLSHEQIEKLLAVKKTAIRAITMGDIQLFRQNIDLLLKHYRKQGMEEAVKEYEFLQEHLDETTIIIDQETEQQIFFSFQYLNVNTENYTLQDSGFMRIDKN